MDKIILKQVEIFANHGVFQEEKNLGQKFVIDLELSLDTKEAAVTGDLTKSVHYGELCHNIEKVFQKESYDLIETAAQKVADYILENYEIVKSVKLELQKPWAPIGRHLKYAAVSIERSWHEAYLSIGSNLGDKEKNLKNALNELEKHKEIKIEKVSEFLVTEPWGDENQDEFLNGAVKIKTTYSPKELMHVLLDTEKEMGKKRIRKWGPRIIDLDVVFYDDLISDDEEIIIPHPRMEEREFVLKPLLEICPYKIHPVLRKPVFRLYEELTKSVAEVVK